MRANLRVWREIESKIMNDFIVEKNNNDGFF